MRVPDDGRVVLGGAGGADDVLEGRAAKAREPADRQVEDAARAHVGRLGVHEVAHVEELDAVAPLRGQLGDGLEVGLLVHADLSGDDCSHDGSVA
ncbi:MAG: hypothetical protein ACK56F_03945, partial [bacterium]